jgi:REP element-mobilizing transposase RayT
MPRYWLLTWTTYGTWLPGDARGSVTRLREGTEGPRIERDVFDTPYTDSIPNLASSSAERLKGEPILLTQEQAVVVADRLESVADYRNWNLLAGSVMANHVHLVIAADEELPSAKLLQSFKNYASRALSERWERPASGTWWTESGSRRPLRGNRAVETACEYVRSQAFVLAHCKTTLARDSGD